MTGETLDFMKNYIERVNRLFRLLVTAVVILELALLIRGLLLFNLERLKLRLYVYSYAFLLTASLAALMMIWIYGHRPDQTRKMLVTIYSYAFCFMMWAAGVTCIDCYADGDSGIIVYVMTCISVGVLTLLKPWIFVCYLMVSSVFLLTVTAFLRGWEPYSSGFYLNFVIFQGTAVFVNSHNYHLSLREYQAKKTLERHADTDPLTGLYNRRKLDKQVQEVLKEQPYILVVLDVDAFKQINDHYGHPMGDTCLEKLARTLSEHFGDQVYRMGGDEFAVVSPFGADLTCRHIEAINRELETIVSGFPLRISAGICIARAGTPQKEVFRNADRALYQAKKTEKVRWVVYEEP